MNDIGIKIKTIRKSKGLTQKQLGDILGISQALIGQYETGKRKPKVEQIARFAEALNVELNELTNQVTYNSEDYLNEYEGMIFLDPEKVNKQIEEYNTTTNRLNKVAIITTFLSIMKDIDFIVNNFENPFTDEEIKQIKEGKYDNLDFGLFVKHSRESYLEYFSKIGK
ncbi:helix-turn-helix domain-containing protein [Anaerosporobacter sp.]